MSNILLLNSSNLVKLREDFEVSFKKDRELLSQNSISLDKDASSKSPNVLYQKLFMAREYTNLAGVTYSKYVKMNVLAKKLLLQKTEERRITLNSIFRENTDILAKFRSSEEKNKYCESLLPEELESTFTQAKMLAEESAGYMQYFRLQFDFYKDIKQDILTQLGIIKTMIELKEFPIVNDITSELPPTDLDNIIKEGVRII